MSIHLKPSYPSLPVLPVTRESEEKLVKHALYDAARNHAVKQEILASTLGVNQSTVSRMMNPVEDHHLTVASLSLLHKDPFTAPVAADVLEAIGARFHMTETKADGDLIDEFLELTAESGKLAQILQDGVQKNEHGKILKIADRLEDMAQQIRAEVNRASSEK